MTAPGPEDTQLREIVADALRTPDHGKLSPWRVVHVTAEQRDTFSDVLQATYKFEKPEAGRLEMEAMDMFARHAPEMLVVLYSPKQSSKIPDWEQELSAGAFCMNILHAAHVRGFVGGWITGWPAYSEGVRNLFGKEPEKVAGFIYLGSASTDLEERPRPELDDILSVWQPDET